MVKSNSFLIVILVIISSFSLHASVVLEGDSNAAAGETFSFPIQEHAASISGENFFVAADPAISGLGQANDFAVSRVMRDARAFMPLTPPKITFNDISDAPNPLFDQGISFLTLLQGGEAELLSRTREHLIAVRTNDLRTIYFFQSIFSPDTIAIRTVENASVLEQNIPDATGATTNAITALTAGVIMTSRERGGFIFAATTPNAGGSFGDPASGIAHAIFGDDISQKDEENIRSVIVLAVVDGPTGQLRRDGGNRATPLDRSSSQVSITSDVASMAVADMHFDRTLGRLFIGLQVTAGAGGADGARAVVMGRITNSQGLELLPIVPDSVFDGALDKIIGAQGANAEVSINKIRTMFTSTALHYLIVQGGNGAPNTTRRTVFALPLVAGNEDPQLNGTIASTSATVEDFFTGSQNNFFVPEGRTLKQPATTAAQMTLSTDLAAQVGGGPLPNGDITDVFVRGDSVFVSVETPTGNEVPGVFYSQALFNETGKIKGWTPWQRVSGNVARVTGFGVDPIRADFTFTDADNASVVRTVRRTNWLDNSDGPVKAFSKTAVTFLPQDVGGVQGLRDFPFSTPGLAEIAALTITGQNTVILAETGSKNAGACIPTSNFPLLMFDQGTITQTFPVGGTKAIAVQGGALCEISPIQTAEFGRNGVPGTNAWLFVGGVEGVAVLSNPDGTGWDPVTQLGVGFDGIVNGMSFKKIGDYRFVRKLISDGQFLYVLTDKQLDRIDLSQGNIGLNQFSAVAVACPEGIVGLNACDSFLDVIISEKFALLATTAGLFRVGNSHNLQTDSDTSIINWTFVPSPEGLGVVKQLLPFSTTGLSQEVALNTIGGQIYSLCAYRGNNQSRVHRFAIQSVEGAEITDDTVQLFPDLYIKNIPSFIVNFGAFRNIIATDGGIFFNTRSKNIRENPLVSLLPAFPELRSGIRFVGIQSVNVPVDISEGNIVAALLRDSASGSWLIGGDFGLRVNE